MRGAGRETAKGRGLNQRATKRDELGGFRSGQLFQEKESQAGAAFPTGRLQSPWTLLPVPLLEGALAKPGWGKPASLPLNSQPHAPARKQPGRLRSSLPWAAQSTWELAASCR